MDIDYLPFEIQFKVVLLKADPAHEVGLMSMQAVYQYGFKSAGVDLENLSSKSRGFHFLFASDTQEYFQMCRQLNELGVDSSALSEPEITSITEMTAGIVDAPDMEKFGPEIYTAAVKQSVGTWILAPVIRKVITETKSNDESDGHSNEIRGSLPDWRYELVGSPKLRNQIELLAQTLYQKLKVGQPLVFGFNLDESGNPFLSEVMVNFGLTGHSIIPTMIHLNGSTMEDFIMKAYFGRDEI